jgi:hypothetical protein
MAEDGIELCWKTGQSIEKSDFTTKSAATYTRPAHIRAPYTESCTEAEAEKRTNRRRMC